MSLSAADVKALLWPWREPALAASAVLTWTEDWHAAIPPAIVAAKYLLLCYWTPTLLTYLAVIGLAVVTADFAGQRILGQVIKATRRNNTELYYIPLPQVFPEASWTSSKASRFDALCSDLSSLSSTAWSLSSAMSDHRRRRPAVHWSRPRPSRPRLPLHRPPRRRPPRLRPSRRKRTPRKRRS